MTCAGSFIITSGINIEKLSKLLRSHMSDWSRDLKKDLHLILSLQAP